MAWLSVTDTDGSLLADMSQGPLREYVLTVSVVLQKIVYMYFADMFFFFFTKKHICNWSLESLSHALESTWLCQRADAKVL